MTSNGLMCYSFRKYFCLVIAQCPVAKIMENKIISGLFEIMRKVEIVSLKGLRAFSEAQHGTVAAFLRRSF